MSAMLAMAQLSEEIHETHGVRVKFFQTQAHITFSLSVRCEESQLKGHFSAERAHGKSTKRTQRLKFQTKRTGERNSFNLFGSTQ